MSDDNPVAISISNEERLVLSERLEAEAEAIMGEAPYDAHILWSHAEALRGDSPLFQPITDTWRIPPNNVPLLKTTLDSLMSDLDAHIGPAYESNLREGHLSLITETYRKLIGATRGEVQ